MRTALRSVGLLMALSFALVATAQQGDGPSKKDLQKSYMDYLKDEGYRPELDKDGDVQFKHEGKTYFLSVTPDDAVFFRLILPNIWPIESELERTQVHIGVDHVNAEAKVAKAYIAQEDVWLAIECFLPEADDFKAIFPRSLEALDGAINLFVTKMREQQAGAEPSE